jgi:hypothetical protein
MQLEGAPSGDVLRRNPITGIAGCCARAASGQAAAPPRSVMNFRRLIYPTRLRASLYRRKDYHIAHRLYGRRIAFETAQAEHPRCQQAIELFRVGR